MKSIILQNQQLCMEFPLILFKGNWSAILNQDALGLGIKFLILEGP
jgi:hypothetical protein